jgi:hypothetical protein
MRHVLACLAVLGMLVACSKAPSANAASQAAAPAAAAQSAAPVSGVYSAGGKPATLTEVSARNDDPFDGKPVTEIIFTVQPQAGSTDIDTDAHQGKLGDALIIRVEPDGTVIGADMVHSGLTKTGGYISATGVLTLKAYSAANGQISGHVTSGGPTDTADQPINVDLTFHTKAP